MSTKHIVVETAIALSADQKKSMQSLLKEKFDATAFEEVVNPAILGGVRITVGSTRYDASLQGKLAQLRTA